MDMFRMLQTLEREPSETTHMHPTGMHGCMSSSAPPVPHDSSPATKMPYNDQFTKGFLENGEKRSGGHFRDNPHKYLLYKPSISQLLVFLSSGFKELPPGGALLLYMSADGCFSTTQHPEDCKCLAIFERERLSISFIGRNRRKKLNLKSNKFLTSRLHC